MYRSSIYKSSAGEAELRALYDDQLAHLDMPTESCFVKTRFGDTHVLVAGPQDAPPLVTVHGVYANAAYNLSLFPALARAFRVYAPDTVGQSVRSAQTYISPAGNDYGYWLVDVLDGLGLASVPFVSSSFGSGIFLRLATVAPERISKAVLSTPSGISNGSMIRIARKLLMPWAIYLLAPNRDRLLRACEPMMSETDEAFIQFVDAMLRNVKMRIEGPKTTSQADLCGLRVPVLIFLAGEDIFFPAERVAPRARRIFPLPPVIEPIPGGHLSSQQTREYINRRIVEFLQ